MAIPKVSLHKVIRKTGTFYQVDFTIDGERKRKIVGSNKRAAELIVAKIQSDIAMGKYDLLTDKKVIDLDSLIGEFLNSKKNMIRDSSYHRYKNYFAKFHKFFYEYFPSIISDVRKIKAIYIKECVDHMLETENNKEKPWARKTVNGMIAIVNSMFIYAEKQEYIDKRPTKDIKKLPSPEKGNPEFFKRDELEKIWKEVDAFWRDPLQFLYFTGLRKGEMINLKWKDVHLDHKVPCITITSFEDWKTKTGKSRIIPLNPNAIKILKKQKENNPIFVFVSNQGNKIHPDKPYHVLKTALKKIGLEGNVHKIRHSFASHLVMKGVGLKTVQELLGHTDIATTQKYAHLSAQHLKNAVDKLI